MDDLLTILNTMMPIIEKKTGAAPSSLHLWFDDIALTSLDAERAVFSTPSPIRRQILSTKHLDNIKEALAEVIGFEVEVEIILSEIPEPKPEEEGAGITATPELIEERLRAIEEAEEKEDTEVEKAETETDGKMIPEGETPAVETTEEITESEE